MPCRKGRRGIVRRLGVPFPARRGGATVANDAAIGVTDALASLLARADASADVRPGAPVDGSYRVAGPVPAATVAPRNEAAVAAVVIGAREHGWTLVPRGGGCRDRWGAPIIRGPLIVLDMRALQGVVAYEPGDLTVRVRSGTAVARLNETLKAQGQVLPCAAGPTSTVGGVIAGDVWGPTRLGHGGPRDLLLGLRAVDGAGRTFAAGGHVVKNVSGLDIGKLFVGSFGSLGVITELSLKLRPIAHREAYWGAVFEAPAAAWATARRVLQSGFQPVGLTLSERTEGARLTVCLQGGETDVAGQLAGLPTVADGGRPLAPKQAQRAWDADQDVGPQADAALAVRCEVAEGELEALAREVAALPKPMRRVAWPGLGVLWCLLGGTAPEALGPGEAIGLIEQLGASARARGGRAVVATCPAEVKAHIQPFGDAGELLPWYRAIKNRFDPDGIFAPGRFVGGL